MDNQLQDQLLESVKDMADASHAAAMFPVEVPLCKKLNPQAAHSLINEWAAC